MEEAASIPLVALTAWQALVDNGDPMKIKDAVVLVTGANRGIGLAFARELLARGAARSTRQRATPPPSPCPVSSLAA
jgi:NADPH:quinone reductase-like Zn-dependent oxidoreductase